MAASVQSALGTLRPSGHSAAQQTIGLLSVDRQDSPSPFGSHDEAVLAILADYVVIALEMQRQAETAASSTESAEDAPSGVLAS